MAVPVTMETMMGQADHTKLANLAKWFLDRLKSDALRNGYELIGHNAATDGLVFRKLPAPQTTTPATSSTVHFNAGSIFDDVGK